MHPQQRRRLALPDLSTKQPIIINAAELFEGGKIKVNRGRRLTTTCLSRLRIRTDFLLSDKLYVRDEVNVTFQGLLQKRKGKRHVLIGSPGVGKSVVFFLAALFQAGCEGKSVIYHRLTEYENPRVFVIHPSGDAQDGSVRISQYEHHRRDHYSIENILDAAEAIGYVPSNDTWRYFIDGPKENDVANLKPMDIYLCTSGGYKTPSDGERAVITIQIMSGWNEMELSCGLMCLKGIRLGAAREAYWHCGGRIRLALDYLRDKDEVVQWANLVAPDASQTDVIIAVGDADARTDIESKDRLRTMFRSPSGKPVQIVDSQYLLAHIRARLDTSALRAAFHVARSLNLRSAMGCLFFEEIVHKWFERNRPSPITASVRPVDVSGLRSVLELKLPLTYWTPSTSNFANIDAAVVVNTVLYCIQYTIASSHKFNMDSFEGFLAIVFRQIPGIAKVVVVFAVPDSSLFQNDHTDFEFEGRTCNFGVIELLVDSDAVLTEMAISGFCFLDSE